MHVQDSGQTGGLVMGVVYCWCDFREARKGWGEKCVGCCQRSLSSLRLQAASTQRVYKRLLRFYPAKVSQRCWRRREPLSGRRKSRGVWTFRFHIFNDLCSLKTKGFGKSQAGIWNRKEAEMLRNKWQTEASPQTHKGRRHVTWGQTGWSLQPAGVSPRGVETDFIT